MQVCHDHHGIGRRLDEDHPRVLFDRRFDVRDVRRVNEIKLDIVVRQNAREETKRAAVGVIRDDDVLARFDEPQRRINRGHPGSEGVTELRAFERSDVAFQREARRVLCPRILETFMLAESFLRVSRSLIDRDGDRARRRVGLLSGMNGCCGETHNNQ